MVAMAMASLQSSMTSLSLSSNSFFGQPLSPITLSPFLPGKTTQKKCLIVMKRRKWERKECKPNSLPVLHKMHVKIGDTVQVIAGREKGQVGEITKVIKHNSTVIVKDVNLTTRYEKNSEEGEPMQTKKVESPIHSSNVMLYSEEKEVASRVGHKVLDNGRKVRYLIKTGEIIDSEEDWKIRREANKRTAEVAAT